MKYFSLATGCLLIAACQSSTEPELHLQPGQYSLVSYNEKAVPAYLDPLPDRSGNRTGCWIVVTSGELTINNAATSFEYSFETRDSCSGSVLSKTLVNGSIVRSEAKTFFVTPGRDGDLRFEVELGAQGVTVHYGSTLLGYQRM